MYKKHILNISGVGDDELFREKTKISCFSRDDRGTISSFCEMSTHQKCHLRKEKLYRPVKSCRKLSHIGLYCLLYLTIINLLPVCSGDTNGCDFTGRVVSFFKLLRFN